MNKRIRFTISFFLLIISFLILSSCGNEGENESKVVKDFFSGLTGAWQVEGEDSFEEWKVAPDSTFTALAYAMEKGDTLIAEHIRIIHEDGSWFYEATVMGQNDEEPVPFKLTDYTDSILTFTHPGHDFPQKIQYQKVDANRMKAIISGDFNDEARTYVFNYVRYMKKKKVTGVGGIFFKSDDPEKMRKWYHENLGLATNEYGSLFEFRLSDDPDKKGYLQWSPFPANTRYFEPSTKDFMINFRVEDIEGLVEELRRGGVTILDTIETYEYGKFLHILDPEGNKIELWEPVESDFTENYEGETTK